MNYEDYILRTKKSLENIDSKISLAFSHQIEDVITIDLAIRSKVKELEIFTLDTKKLFKESLEYQSMVEDFFKIKIKTYQADENSLKSIDLEIGEYGMRENLQKRKLCCEVRKITPLKKALSESKAWISGIRAEDRKSVV